MGNFIKFREKKVYILRDAEDNRIFTNCKDMLCCFPSYDKALKECLKLKLKTVKIDQAMICFKK